MNFRPNGILQLFNYPPPRLMRLYFKKRTCFHLLLKIDLYFLFVPYVGIIGKGNETIIYFFSALAVAVLNLLTPRSD